MENSNHYKLAKEVLRDTETFLINKGYIIKRDNWSFHIIVNTLTGKNLSIFCSGYNSRLELIPLSKSGHSNTNYKERTFKNIELLYNYLNKRWQPVFLILKR